MPDDTSSVDPRIEPATQALYARHTMWQGIGNGELSPMLWADLDAEEQESYRSDIPITLAAADAADRAAGIVRINLDDPALEERLGRWHYDSPRLGWSERSRDTAWEHDPGPDREASLAWSRELLKELRRAAQ